MATQTAAILNSALSLNFRPELTYAVNRAARATMLFPVRGYTGKSFNWDHIDDGATAETFADGADVSDFSYDAIVAAILKNARYRSNFIITGDVAQQVGTTESPEGLRDFMQHNLFTHVTKIASKLNGDFHTADGSDVNGILGAPAVLDDNNVYAGIDRTVYPQWRATVIDPGIVTAVTQDDLRRDVGDRIWTQSNEIPDLGFAGPKTWYTIANLFQAQKRYNIDVVNLNGRGPIRLTTGDEAIDIGGCNLVKDKDVPEGRIEYWNTRYCSWYVLGRNKELERDMKFRDALLAQDDMPLNDGNLSSPFGLKAYMLATLGDAFRYTIVMKPIFVCRRPNSCGIRYNVAYNA